MTPEQKIIAALSLYTHRSGYQLSQLTGLGPGLLYPALLQLEQDGTVASEWEDMPPPRRRRYRLIQRKETSWRPRSMVQEQYETAWHAKQSLR